MVGAGLRVRAHWGGEIYMIGKRRATGVHMFTRPLACTFHSLLLHLSRSLGFTRLSYHLAAWGAIDYGHEFPGACFT
jgi:hypothetical protein